MRVEHSELAYDFLRCCSRRLPIITLLPVTRMPCKHPAIARSNRHLVGGIDLLLKIRDHLYGLNSYLICHLGFNHHNLAGDFAAARLTASYLAVILVMVSCLSPLYLFRFLSICNVGGLEIPPKQYKR